MKRMQDLRAMLGAEAYGDEEAREIRANNDIIQIEIFNDADRDLALAGGWDKTDSLPSIYALWARMLAEPRGVAVYGAGKRCQWALWRILGRANVPIVVADSNPSKTGSVVEGYTVLSAEAFYGEHGEDYVLISSRNYAYDIRDQLVKSGIPRENIYALDA